jgi:hypothetical protein
VNRDSAIRLAHKDTVWQYEDLDTTMVRPGFPDWQTWPPFSFDVGPGDAIGVVGLGRLAEFTDRGWSSEQLPMPMTHMAFSYDPASRPSLTFRDSLWHGCLGVRTDSGWDTSVVFIPQGYPSWFSLTRPCWRRQGDCAFLYENDWGELIQEYSVGLRMRDSGIWTVRGLAYGLDGSGEVFAALADGDGSIHMFWSAADRSTSELVCDSVLLDGWTNKGAACLDTADRVQCAWVPFDSGGLKFAIPGLVTWIVQDTGSLAWCDITTDTLSEPVIAFCRDDGSIWVAHGIGIVGMTNERKEAAVRVSRPEASVVRGVLFLTDAGHDPNVKHSGSCPKPSLLDISGRKVMDLSVGANDVSRLAPGVYFVATPSLCSSPPEGERVGVRRRGAWSVVTKVVIAR